ncbi:MAG: PAS domain S-box protein [Kofleriaceae bacterium]
MATEMEDFYRGQCAILERVARGAPLADLLDEIVRLIERFGADMACTILLLDETGTRVRNGAAPSLPEEYVRALDGQPIGAHAGSCGAAAFLKRPVIVEDIATDPNWVDYRELALRSGLRACWSTPIMSDDKVLGTFAMYYREPRGPSTHDRELVTSATHIAAIAIAHDATLRALRDREERATMVANALRKSEERLRAVIEHTPDVAIQWYDDDGRITFCNRASLELFGWNANAVIGKTLLEIGFFSPAEEARFARSRALAAAGKPPPPIEFTYRRVDGSPGWVFSTVFQIPFGTNESCIVCMDVDVTEHRRAQDAIRAGEALRAMVFDSVADPIFSIAVESDGEGEDATRYRFVSVNRAFLHATGLREEDVVGRDASEVIPEPSYSLVRTKYREAISTRSKICWEELTPYPTGARHGMVSVAPIFDEAGRCTLVGTVHDITDLRRSDEERRTLESQLHQNQRLQSLGTLASGIAHDFNNILAAISSNAGLVLEADLPPDEVYQCVTDIQAATQRATKLVRQILQFARKQEARKELGDMRPVIEEAIALVDRATSARVRIRTHFPVEPMQTMFDATQLHQVIVNLVTNAVHAKADSIDITLEPYVHTGRPILDLPEGRYLRLSITDSGSGMDEATLARIFDPFFTTKPATEGTGLGLSIVHEIVRGHSGAITVRSRRGEGTTFDLYFPRMTEDPVAARPGHGQRILLVDDEDAMVFLGTRLLTKLGYRVTGHANPIRALEEFRAAPQSFEAVISDLAMPGMSGVALLDEVRKLRPDIPVILTSGYARPEDLETSRSHGFGELIPKPHTADEFAWAVSRRLQNPDKQRAR